MSNFSTVVPQLPPGAPVLDLSGSDVKPMKRSGPWSIGRYDEVRGIYTSALFSDGRTLHVGIDIGGPVGTKVCAFTGCRIYALGNLTAEGDYGHVVVTEQVVEGRTLWALFGHLSAASVEKWSVGDAVSSGDILGWFGDETENGGWPPHLHLQLSWVRPEGFDIPGVVRPDQREWALARYPDPRIVLGNLYE
jgi:murein DD-endopeptidase MepM/ murein hydrolase activator NlpD